MFFRSRFGSVTGSVTRAVTRASLAVALSFTATGSARAYCRTHTNDPGQSSCPPLCANLGNPLAWYTADISYGFNQRGFPGLSDAQMRTTFANSIGAWEQVMCSGQLIGFNITQLAGTTTLEQGPMSAEPNENVITHYDAAGWADLQYSNRAFAITAVWFAKDGQIFGADMGFNGGMDLYGDCAVDQCSSGSTGNALHTDLQNVATHEFGHFLGLSHSDVEGSTMSCDAQASDTDKRTLAADDIAGLCASYPLATSFPDDRKHGGCGLADGAGGATAWAGVSLLFAARRRARRKSAGRV